MNFLVWENKGNAPKIRNAGERKNARDKYLVENGLGYYDETGEVVPFEGLNEMLKSFKEYSIVHVKSHTGKKDYNSINNDIVDKMATEILLDTKEELKDRNENLMPDLQLSLMGPPLEEHSIIEWCKTHFDLLDSSALKTGLFSAFQKTMKKNGYILELQTINKQKFVRVSANKLIQDTNIIGWSMYLVHLYVNLVNNLNL